MRSAERSADSASSVSPLARAQSGGAIYAIPYYMIANQPPNVFTGLNVTNARATWKPLDGSSTSGDVAGGGAVCTDVAVMSRLTVTNASAIIGSGGAVQVRYNATIANSTFSGTAARLVRAWAPCPHAARPASPIEPLFRRM